MFSHNQDRTDSGFGHQEGENTVTEQDVGSGLGVSSVAYRQILATERDVGSGLGVSQVDYHQMLIGDTASILICWCWYLWFWW
jgi:hypothetical protein